MISNRGLSIRLVIVSHIRVQELMQRHFGSGECSHNLVIALTLKLVMVLKHSFRHLASLRESSKRHC